MPPHRPLHGLRPSRTLSPPPPPSQGLSIMANAAAIVEIARVDCSMSTFLLVHSHLAMLTIGLLVGGGAAGGGGASG